MTDESQPAGPALWDRPVVTAALLCGLVLALYANGLGSYFLSDDFEYLSAMKQMSGIGDVLRFTFWGEWEPLGWLGWYIDFQIWGTQPAGHHLSSVLWLMAAMVALHALVRRLWPEPRWIAWGVALLFAVYPLHDEAVTYISSRGHVIGLALAFVALWLYTGARRTESRRGRFVLFAASFLLALLAALAKETFLVLPVWVGALEWLVISRGAPQKRALLRGVGAGGLFASAALASLAVRFAVVGVGSGKIGGVLDKLLPNLAEQLPVYALLGGFPVPAGWLDLPVLSSLAVFGWLALAAALAAGVLCAVVCARGGRTRPWPGMCAAGMAIAASSLAPVFWAGLVVHRRYLFLPSVGIVLVAIAALGWLMDRRRRTAAGVLGLMVVVGAAATLHRNALYHPAGDIARNFIEVSRGAPLDVQVPRRGRIPQIMLVALPGWYGGDAVSGVYVLHHSDLKSALDVYDLPQRFVAAPFYIDHADAVSARVLPGEPRRVELTFGTDAVFERTRESLPPRAKLAERVRLYKESEDPVARTVTFRFSFPPGRTPLSTYRVLLYGDGTFTRVPVP